MESTFYQEPHLTSFALEHDVNRASWADFDSYEPNAQADHFNLIHDNSTSIGEFFPQLSAAVSHFVHQVPSHLSTLPPFHSAEHGEHDENDVMSLDEATVTSPRSTLTPREFDVKFEVKEEPIVPVDPRVRVEWRDVFEDDDEGEERGQKVQCYVCPVSSCQRSYRRKGDLKVHCKKKHSDLDDLPDMISKPRSSRQNKPYPCPVDGCPCGFLRQRGLQRHFRKKHPYLASPGTLGGSSEGSDEDQRALAFTMKFDSESYSD